MGHPVLTLYSLWPPAIPMYCGAPVPYVTSIQRVITTPNEATHAVQNNLQPRKNDD